MSYLSELEAISNVLPSGVHHATISHDSDCQRPSGGTCTCSPDITLEQVRFGPKTGRNDTSPQAKGEPDDGGTKV